MEARTFLKGLWVTLFVPETQDASRSRCADIVDRSGLTPADAQKAGRDRLPDRFPRGRAIRASKQTKVKSTLPPRLVMLGPAIACTCDDRPRPPERPNPIPAVEATHVVSLRHSSNIHYWLCVLCGNYTCFRVNIVPVFALCAIFLTTPANTRSLELDRLWFCSVGWEIVLVFG